MTKARIHGAPLRVVDTGWAWVVAAAACFCLFFTCGFAYSTGIYYVIFLETFGGGKGPTAWITSLNFGILCAVGPIASLLINNISCRFTVFVGGLLSTAGLFISAFAASINTLFFTFGVLTGAGFGLVFTSCVVVISEYFVKYRVIAMGLSISGTGLGTIAYPWMSRMIIEIYGWRGALILSAGINAHVCIASLIMRPNREVRKIKKTKNPKSPVKRLQQQYPEKQKYDEKQQYPEILQYQEKRQHQEKQQCPEKQQFLEKQQLAENESENSLCSPTSEKSVSTPSSVETKNSYNSSLSANHQNQAHAQSLTDSLMKLTLVKRLARDFDLDIFTKPTFLLISANTFLFCFGMSVMYTHISAYAASVSLPVAARDSLLSSIGLTNLIGRVLLGLAAQFLPLDATWLFIGSYFLAGLGVALCALWTSFPGLLVCVCTFGFFSAGFGPLLSEVTCLSVGVMKFSMAYGYLMVFMAAGTMIGAPIAGALYDTTQYYQGSFYLGGACLILASVIMLPDVVPSRWRTRNYDSASVDDIFKKRWEEVEVVVSSV